MLKPGYKFAPHQETAIQRMERDKCNPLFFDMGCFKTATVIGHVERSRHMYKHVLVVVPKDNLKTWKDELDERLDTPNYSILPDGHTKRLQRIKDYVEDSNTKFLVVNYDCLRSDKLYQLLKKNASMFDYIVFDEAYATHNVQAIRNKRWYSIRKKVPRCTVMDGDPTAEGEEKVFGIYKMMDMGATFGTSHWDFMEEYFVRIDDLYWVPGRDTKERIGKIIAETAIRVTKAQVLPWLPPVVYETRYVTMLPEQKKLYNQMAKEFAVELDKNTTLEVDYVIAQLQKLKQITGGFCYVPESSAKRIANVKEAATREVMRQNKKLVIWAMYREEIKLIEEISLSMGRNPVIFHGGMSADAKIFARNKFKNDPTCTDFIGQADCGIGMNDLVVAGTAFYYSRSEKRRSRSQSIARLDRPGQQADKVTIIDVIVVSSIDEHNFKRLKTKGKRSEMLLNYELKGAIRGKL